MATKQELKAEIVVLRKRVDELAARVATLESERRARVETANIEPPHPWRWPWVPPIYEVRDA